jgi:hypothetical protein
MEQDLTVIVTALIGLSVAAERVVEIVKGTIVWLDKEKEDPRMEARRRATLQALAAGSGILVSWLAWPVTQGIVPGSGADRTLTIIALGLLASGGSGFWNAILGYVMSIKALKSAAAASAKHEAIATGTVIPQPKEGRFVAT